MNEKWQKAEFLAKKIVISLIFAGFAVLLIYLTPKLLILFLPLVVAYVISTIATPVTVLLEKLRFPSQISAVISILFVAALLFGISSLVVYAILQQTYSFFSSMPQIYNSFSSTLLELKDAANNATNHLPHELVPHLEDILSNFSTYLDAISSTVIETLSSWAVNTLKFIPSFLIGILFSVLASYFFIRDKRKIKSHIASLIPCEIRKKIDIIRKDVLSAILAYLRAQGILMSITFVEVFVGLSVLGVEYSLIFAIIIALVDAIPVFGTGTILLPWALYSLLTGAYTTTIALAVLYAVCLIVRQMLEPKILSQQIGMHPLLTLLAIYVGFRLFGVFGMLFGPTVALIGKNCLERYLNVQKTP